jgi:PIN domain nuclease of toxin-antitoxin system
MDITHLHASAVEGLPNHHRDPFNRILIAQVLRENMILLTADHVLQAQKVQMIFCGKMKVGVGDGI